MRAVVVVVVVLIVGSLVWFTVDHHHHKHSQSATSPPTTSSPGSTAVAPAPAGGMDRLDLGATLTQTTTLDATLPATLLNNAVSYINVSLGDDGTVDPEPQPGVYDWSSLDARMRQLAPLNTAVVLRAFDAPPWMTATGVAKTAPLPQYYQAFANLVLATLQRYRQIHYLVVWNELKGFRDGPNNWNAQAYTTFYNTVYTTVKAHLPNVLVGGPYVPFPPATGSATPSSITGPWGAVSQSSLDAITYWLQHRVGADFLAVDGRTALPPTTPAQPFASTEMFSAIDSWLHQQTTLPIWWMEWYARSPKIGAPAWNAASAYALMQLAASGASNALLWDPEFVSSTKSTATPGIWVSGTDADTALTPEFEVLKSGLFGTSVTLSSPGHGVELLTNGSSYIAVNTQNQDESVPVLGTPTHLSPYAIVTSPAKGG
jgi:hypothetical protein